MTQRRLCVSAVLAAGTGWLAPATSQAAATDWVGDAHAAVRLIVAGRPGEGATRDAGLEFRFAPGWHGYWRTPGDAGLPPSIDWSGSDNVERAEIAWPAPARLVVEGLQNSVYAGRIVLPVRVRLRTAGAPGRLHAAIGFAACSKVCVPYEADLALPLRDPPDDSTDHAEATLIDAARARIPGAPSAAGFEVVGTSVVRDGSAPALTIDLRSRTTPFVHPDLFIEGAGDGLPAAPQLALGDGGRSARLTIGLPASFKDGSLTATLTDGERAAEFAVGPARDAAPVEPGPARAGLLAALVSALIGGLILNLMPCVLPVLSIKVLGVLRHAQETRGVIRRGFLATALGVISSFLLIAVALIALQRSGVVPGWGIQFQQPWFLAGMASLTVLFAASCFDWLSIGLPGRLMSAAGHVPHASLTGSYLTGAFATLLATPCSAPFVGTAVGFALGHGPVEILAIFLCLGLGMALPYGAAALVPGLVVRLLPRPGPWMLTLRKALGLLLVGTALWLLVVLGSTAGVRMAGVTGCLLALLLAVRALRRPTRGAAGRWMGVATAVLAVAPVGIVLVAPPAALEAGGPSAWSAFDAEALPGLVAQGRTVLVDVTATWCLTCKINELTALERPEVASRIAQGSVVRMRADWSRPNRAIADYLHGFSRYGIPLDVVYGPGRPAGEPLPELLTTASLLAALDAAAAPAPATAPIP